jgi:hypothetical protein
MTERQKKTPAERATEALETAMRVEERALERLAKAKETIPPLEAEVQKVQARVAYLLANPDLPEDVREMYAPDDSEEAQALADAMPEPTDAELADLPETPEG